MFHSQLGQTKSNLHDSVDAHLSWTLLVCWLLPHPLVKDWTAMMWRRGSLHVRLESVLHTFRQH